MRNFRTEGIIIKRRNFKDSDRILTILTKTHGKIYVKAAGVRKITSRRAGHIEVLNHAALSLYQAHAYPLLTEATTINNFSEIKSDLNNIGLALHLCELVDGLCPENQENSFVFYLLQQTLGKIVKGESNSALINNFETRLLTSLGYWNNREFVFDQDRSEIDTQKFIENILERKLKSRNIFTKIQ